MAAKLVYTVRMSESMQAFLAATLDLVQAIEEADEVLVADEIREAADRLLGVIEDRRGEL